MRFLNKKGISPLIATVLLIGFTVALAAVVITWGSGFVNRVTTGTDQRTSKAISCTGDLDFEITKVTCPDTILVNNKGNLAIESLNLRFFDENGNLAGVPATTAPIEKYELKSITQAIPVGTTKVEAIATVIIDGQEAVCSEAAKQRTFSPAC